MEFWSCANDRLVAKIAFWCRLRESNPRPTAYKAVALPAELNRLANDPATIVSRLEVEASLASWRTALIASMASKLKPKGQAAPLRPPRPPLK